MSMSREEEIRNIRIGKISRLEEAGMDAYVPEVKLDISLREAGERFSELEESGEERALMGRILSKRSAGKIAFATLFDGTGKFQVVLKQDELGKERMKQFEKLFDIGDFAAFTGTFFRTQRGEPSLLVKDFRMLTKSLRPLPEKWVGLQDPDEIYRKLYLSLLMNPEAFERFITRAKIIRAIRHFLDERGFLEVEGSILQNETGGAMAKPFITHHNDLDVDMVLRISLEIEHKMIMVAGYPRIYEIGKAFRNEGSDPTHIQEFTMLEWYAAYETLEQNMAWTEELLKMLARDVVGKIQFRVKDKEGQEYTVDFDRPWERVRFGDLLERNAGISIDAPRDVLGAKAREYGMPEEEVAKTGDANLLDFIYKKSSRNHIIHPTFVTDYPGSLKPLAQQNPDGTARVAQLIIAGAEITNQYAELVDPLRQRELLEAQARAREAGDEEAMSVNERFLTAMEYGMPPMTGFGMGIDRLVALLTEQDNLRDTIFFPLMRPKK